MSALLSGSWTHPAEGQHQSSAKEYEVEILRLEAEGHALSEMFAADAHEAASRIQFLEAQVKSLETSLSEKTRDFELSQAKLTDSQARVGELTNHINARDKDLSIKERELQKALAKSEIDQESLHRSEKILAQDEKERAELKSQNQQLIGQLTSLKSRAESHCRRRLSFTTGSVSLVTSVKILALSAVGSGDRIRPRSSISTP